MEVIGTCVYKVKLLEEDLLWHHYKNHLQKQVAVDENNKVPEVSPNLKLTPVVKKNSDILFALEVHPTKESKVVATDSNRPTDTDDHSAVPCHYPLQVRRPLEIRRGKM